MSFAYQVSTCLLMFSVMVGLLACGQSEDDFRASLNSTPTESPTAEPTDTPEPTKTPTPPPTATAEPTPRLATRSWADVERDQGVWQGMFQLTPVMIPVYEPARAPVVATIVVTSTPTPEPTAKSRFPVPGPVPTPLTPYPFVSSWLLNELTPIVTFTPTPKPQPTAVPTPTAAPLPTVPPTLTPKPTAPMPPTTTPVLEVWGNWIRDSAYEDYWTQTLAQSGYSGAAQIVTLIGVDGSQSELLLTLACVSGLNALYLVPIVDFPPIDSLYEAGVFLASAERKEVVEGVERLWFDINSLVSPPEMSPRVTNNLEQIAFTDYLQIESILSMIQTAHDDPELVLLVGLFAPENGGDNTHFGVFDPIGLDSTLAYLDCFESSQ